MKKTTRKDTNTNWSKQKLENQKIRRKQKLQEQEIKHNQGQVIMQKPRDVEDDEEEEEIFKIMQDVTGIIQGVSIEFQRVENAIEEGQLESKGKI